MPILDLLKKGGPRERSWTEYLADEDLAFIRRFVLASGSLKGIARVYGVSYPTVRLRLDRLIERIRIYEDQAVESEFERVARAQYAEGRIELDTLRLLLDAHVRELQERGGEP